MKKCPVCGKEFDVLWPDLWRYREGSAYICTWKCLRQLRKEAEEKVYTKVKKDGTPAKKSGPKTTARKIDIAPKSTEVTLVYDPSIAEEYKREQEAKKKSFEEMKLPVPEEKKIQGQEPLEVASLKSRVLQNGYYRKNSDGTGMWLEGGSMEKDALGLCAKNWIRLSEEIRVAMEQLQIRAEDPEDYTGNNGPL